ncbi:MAG TPA: OB-fold domain-containing protein [Solirubrobacteraceae bacterium]|jgi:uncharacterized OB-fold protein|nr:OB-fold domain-containing protein [Solirubrobacteraceae bacterium]
MSDTPAIPMPEITDVNRPFWDGCREGELRLQRCDGCGLYRFPDAPVCPRCLSRAFSWQAVSGRGTVWSWIRMHQNYLPAFADQLPYVVLFVDLEEGPRLISGFVGDPDELAIDLPVQAVFETVGERVIPKFRAVG